jgi:hypothetical protein
MLRTLVKPTFKKYLNNINNQIVVSTTIDKIKALIISDLYLALACYNIGILIIRTDTSNFGIGVTL